jgi:hypothetical protein
VAAEKNLVIEREAEDRIKNIIRQYVSAEGAIDHKEFEDTLAMFNDACKGKIPDAELKRRLKKMMVDNGWQAKEGGLFGNK